MINQTQEEQKLICLQHSKDLDAFCMTDKTLICINCILEGEHNSHELLTIKK